MSVHKEHLILKVRYSLLSSSLLQLFIEFTVLIDGQHMTKLLKTAMAHAAVLKFSLHHPDSAATAEDRRMSLENNLLVQCTEQIHTY